MSGTEDAPATDERSAAEGRSTTHGRPGGWALATSSGKDGTLALLRAREAGLRVDRSVTLIGVETGRVRFHGAPPELVGAQARALGLDPIVRTVAWDEVPAAWDEILAGLAAAGVEGVIFGNLHLTDVREWYEERVTGAGLRHLEPLWGEDPEAVVREVVERGVRATVVAVDAERGDTAWLGRSVDHARIDDFLAAGIDPCGEFGEYHTFVWDGPGFSKPVRFTPRGRRFDGTVHVLELESGDHPVRDLRC